MVTNNFEWKNDWDKVQELLNKISEVVLARSRFISLREFDKSDTMRYKFTRDLSSSDGAFDREFAKTINELIEDYVRDEES